MRQQDTYIWRHPTIREYLAACALRSKYKKRWKHFVKGHWTSAQWQEVTLFLLAMLDRDNIDTMNFTNFLIRRMHYRDSFLSCLISIVLLLIFFIAPAILPNANTPVTWISNILIVFWCVWAFWRSINSSDYNKNKDELLFLLRWLAFKSLPDDKVYSMLKSLLVSMRISNAELPPAQKNWTYKRWQARQRTLEWIGRETQRATLASELLKELDREMIMRIVVAIQRQESEHTQKAAKLLQDMISPGGS
jgi:hypothetical protein